MAPLLEPLAKLALRLKLTPNFVTGCGTLVGLGCIPALALRLYPLAGGLFLLNRFLDGLDGTMARQTQPTAYGAYLDIVSDMLVYGGFVFGFALAQPENAIWAACLLFAFIGKRFFRNIKMSLLLKFIFAIFYCYLSCKGLGSEG